MNTCGDALDSHSGRSFPQFPHVSSGRVPQLGHARFLQNPFQFIRHPTARGYTV
jgi:hypothetical protein